MTPQLLLSPLHITNHHITFFSALRTTTLALWHHLSSSHLNYPFITSNNSKVYRQISTSAYNQPSPISLPPVSSINSLFINTLPHSRTTPVFFFNYSFFLVSHLHFYIFTSSFSLTIIPTLTLPSPHSFSLYLLLSQVIYRLEADTESDVEKFTISTIDGEGVLRLVGELDYERKSLYQLRVSELSCVFF